MNRQCQTCLAAVAYTAQTKSIYSIAHCKCYLNQSHETKGTFGQAPHHRRLLYVIRRSLITNILCFSSPHSLPVLLSLPSLVNCHIAPELIVGCRLPQCLNHKYVSDRKNSFPCQELECLSGSESSVVSAFVSLNGALSAQVLGREGDTIVARPLRSEVRSRWLLYGVYSQELSTDTCALLRGSGEGAARERESVLVSLRAKCGGMDRGRQRQRACPVPRLGCGPIQALRL